MATAVSAYQHVKQADGTYKVVFPINTSEEVFTDLAKGEKLTARLAAMSSDLSLHRENIIEDMITVLSALTTMIDKPLRLNNIYIDDLSVPGTMNIMKGIYEPGRVFI